MNFADLFIASLEAMAKGDRKEMERLAQLDRERVAEIRAKEGK